MQQDPATRVSAPAIGLLVAGGLSAAFDVVYILIAVLLGVAGLTDKDSADALPAAGIMVGLAVIKLALDTLTLYAAWQMRQLRSWGVSMAGAIVAMLPCSPCCLLSLPIGVWAVVVLIDANVKAAFDGGARPGPGYGGPSYPPQA